MPTPNEREPNSFKGTRIAAPDPATGVEVALFNPREQDWSQHFRWDDGGTRVVGLTPTGRATVEALRLNNPYIVPEREIEFFDTSAIRAASSVAAFLVFAAHYGEWEPHK